ncbi:Syntaxin [Sesbania bispinosa]|nr:Syntaxin [Sesbania bispinosa]
MAEAAIATIGLAMFFQHEVESVKEDLKESQRFHLSLHTTISITNLIHPPTKPNPPW